MSEWECVYVCVSVFWENTKESEYTIYTHRQSTTERERVNAREWDKVWEREYICLNTLTDTKRECVIEREREYLEKMRERESKLQ